MKGRTVAGVLLFYAAATVVMTWPQALHLHDVRDHFDPLFSIWRLAWVAHRLPREPWHLFDTNIFHPEPLTLAYSDAMLLQGLVMAPWFWSGGNPAVGYNLLLLASLAASGAAMFLLARSLTGHTGAALVAGFAFAFSPYRFEHYHHLELQFAMWMPLGLWAIHRAVRTGAVKDGLLAGGLVAAQTLSCLYYGIFFATTLLVFVPVLLLGQRALRHGSATPERGGAGRLGRQARALAAGAVLTAVLTLPYLLPYTGSRNLVGTRPAHEIQEYSATVTNYLAAPPDNRLYGWTSSRFGGNERNLFPGLVLLGLAIVGVWPPLSPARLAYAIALLVAFEAARGLNGFLFEWLQAAFLPYRGLRVPARFAVLVHLLLAVLAASGVARLFPAGQHSRMEPVESQSSKTGGLRARLSGSSTLRYAAVPLLILGMAAEYSVRPLGRIALPTDTPAVYTWLRHHPPVVIMEYPVVEPDRLGLSLDPFYMYYSTFHWQRLLNGYSGFFPRSYIRLLELMRTFPDDRSIDELRYRGADYLLVHPGMDYWGFAVEEGTVERLEQRKDVQLLGRFAGPRGETRVYRIAP